MPFELNDNEIIASNNCRYCGVNTKTEEGYVNRISHGMGSIDCYACGPCQDKIEAIDEDEDRDMSEFDDVYLPERIAEIDAKYPNAILFRTVIELVEGQGYGPYAVQMSAWPTAPQLPSYQR